MVCILFAYILTDYVVRAVPTKLPIARAMACALPHSSHVVVTFQEIACWRELLLVAIHIWSCVLIPNHIYPLYVGLINKGELFLGRPVLDTKPFFSP